MQLKNGLLAIMLTFCFLSANAQYQSVFGKQQTSWLLNTWGVTPEGVECFTDSLWLVSGNDTTINGSDYRLLMKKSAHNATSYLVGFVREDTMSGTVWYRGSGFDTLTHTLLNMSLNLNDTFRFDYGSAGSFSSVVDSIYFKNGRKFIQLDYTETLTTLNGNKAVKYTMIEGVGVNLRGLNHSQGNSILKWQEKDDFLNYNGGLSSFFQCDLAISDSAIWHYSGPNGGNVPGNSEYYRFAIIKDTIYKGQEAQKVARKHYQYSGDSAVWRPLYLSNRNDSVFYYNEQYQSYILLYDYTANAGDTLRFYLPDTAFVSLLSRADSSFRLVVDSVKKQNYNGIDLRVFYTTQLDGFGYNLPNVQSGLSYIEKIGSSYQMLPQAQTTLLVHDGPIRCYEDQTLFYNFWGQACDYRIISNLEEQGTPITTFKVQPNPAQKFLKLELNGLMPVDLSLFNLKGELIMQFDPTKTKLNLSALSNGVYILRLTTKDQQQLEQKIVVQP